MLPIQYRTGVNAPSALTDASPTTLDASLSDDFTLLLTAAIGATRVLSNPTNLTTGQGFVVRFKQPAAGGPCNVTYDTLYKFPGGAVPTLTTAADAVDLLTCFYDGTIILADLSKDYK